MSGIGEGAVYAILTSLAASGINYAQNEKTNDQRVKAINNAGDVQSESQKKSENALRESASKYNPEERINNQEVLASQTERSLGSALTEAQSGIKADTSSGRVSDDFLTSNAKATTDRLARGASLAKMMARMRSPNDLRFAEGLSNADTASRVRGLFGDQQSAISAGGLDASSVTPNGGAMLASDLLRAGGQAAYRPKTSNSQFYGDKGSGIYGPHS